MRRTASIIAIVLGAIMIVAGVATWVAVTNTLSDQRITVAKDADCMAGKSVDNPIAAYCQAKVIDKHTTKITGGKTYAELAQDDPNRPVAMTASFLQSSLFTSVVAYGIAAMAAAIGVLFILIGLGMRDVATTRTTEPPTADA